MKLFGEYLVEKEIVSEENLAKALVEQIKCMPATAESVFEKNLMPIKDFLLVLRRQNEKRSGFIEAATELKLWNADMASQVEAHTAAGRKPLGQILVGLGAADLRQITLALDDFLSEVPELPVAPAVDEPESIHEPEVTVAAAAEPADLSSFCDLFTDDLRAKLETALDDEDLKSARDDIHRLKGAARLFKAEQLETLLTSLEEMMQDVFKIGLDKLSPDLFKKFLKVYQSNISFLWEIQGELRTASNENEIVGDDARRVIMRELAASIEVFKFDLSFL